MKSVAVILVIVQSLLVQHGYSQCIRPCGAVAAPVVTSPMVTQASVANTLADTLSLLTVSSLLAETLPLNANVIATVPVPVPVTSACSPVVSNCGCNRGCGCSVGGYGLGYGCGGYGINYII